MGKIKTVLKAIKILKNWPVYFLDYFSLVKSPYVFFKLKNGIIFKIRSKTNDRVVFNQIWLDKTYTPEGFEIKESDTVVDIGAHIGFFSIFAAIVAIKGKVYAFEPSPDNFNLLRENVELNKIHNVELINKAVAKEGGIKEFALSSDDPAGHSFAYGETDRREINVPTISLDDFLRQENISRIDFLKMDCEGAEYEIFFNCSNNTLDKIKKISMEYHDVDAERTASHIRKFLEQKRFIVEVKTIGDNMLYARK